MNLRLAGGAFLAAFLLCLLFFLALVCLACLLSMLPSIEGGGARQGASELPGRVSAGVWKGLEVADPATLLGVLGSLLKVPCTDPARELPAGPSMLCTP